MTLRLFGLAHVCFQVTKGDKSLISQQYFLNRRFLVTLHILSPDEQVLL